MERRLGDHRTGAALRAMMLPAESSAAGDKPAAPPGTALPSWHPFHLAQRWLGFLLRAAFCYVHTAQQTSSAWCLWNMVDRT